MRSFPRIRTRVVARRPSRRIFDAFRIGLIELGDDAASGPYVRASLGLAHLR